MQETVSPHTQHPVRPGRGDGRVLQLLREEAKVAVLQDPAAEDGESSVLCVTTSTQLCNNNTGAPTSGVCPVGG